MSLLYDLDISIEQIDDISYILGCPRPEPKAKILTNFKASLTDLAEQRSDGWVSSNCVHYPRFSLFQQDNTPALRDLCRE